MAAAAAVIGIRNARRRPQTAAVSQQRMDEWKAEMKRVRVVNDVFRKYDTNRSGKLEKSQVSNLLSDIESSTPAGSPPSDEELEFIMKLCDNQCENDAIDRSELESALSAWSSYSKKREQMQEALDRFDVSGSGKLEKPELKEYLKHLNNDMDVTDEEVDWVLSNADVFGDGAISKPELAKATAVWYSHVDAQNKGCCALQ
eukprot:TRINITY_DN16827_c0_g1_i1.p1 TRINITY_DN16827_c0_g1~~TRINITY_DN16827_c0_g1_i1.p1  ORF type:complete len:225 (+),score=44.20 TRINITY_DN16827_c0_g1_i1:75-677(+)